MKFPLPASPFPSLSLSPEDEHKLEKAAEAVVKKTVQEYHELLTVHGGVIDDKRWKKIKQREDIRVYKERSGSVDDTASNTSSDSQGESENSTEFKGVLSTLLTFGMIQGSLDDVMYGALNPTTADMQLKTAYCEDGYADWEVLARIFKPTAEDPFRELSIKWVVKKFMSPLLRAVSRVRDAVYIESVGFAETLNGERIGYVVRQSVDIPEICELSNELNIVRSKVSFSRIFRQRKSNCVEVFIRGFISPFGDTNASLAALTAADVSVSDWRNTRCAEMKKLERMLRASQQQRQGSCGSGANSSNVSFSSSSTTDSQSGSASTSSASSPGTCSICSQSLSSGLFSGSKEKKKCRICRESVCSRCRVQKTMFLPTPQRKVLDAVAMAFCTRCVLGASSASSAEFAVLDTLEAEGERVDYLEALNKKAP